MSPAVFRVFVDESRVERAVAELHAALVAQNVAFAARFERGIYSREAQRVLRRVALSLCVVGTALSCYIVASVPVGCRSRGVGFVCFALFGTLGLIFFRMVDIQDWLQSRSRRWAGKKLRLRASKNLAPMRVATPVDIEYVLKDATVSGEWLRDGKRERSWVRKLDKFAYVGETLCAIFAKKSSFYPRVIIVHDDRESVVGMLQARGVEVSALPCEVPAEYGNPLYEVTKCPSDPEPASGL